MLSANAKIATKTAAKVIVSACLIALVIRAADLDGILDRLAHADPWIVALAAGITLAISLVHAARWLIVIRAGGDSLRYAQALQIVLIGYFFNQLLPSSVGGDAVRVWRAFRAGIAIPRALNSVILDRLSALAGLVIVTGTGLPWLLPAIHDPKARAGLIALIAAVLAGFIVLFYIERLPWLSAQWRLTRFITRLSTVSRKLFLDVGHSVPAIGISVFVHLVGAAVVFILARGIGVQIGLLECLVLVPPVMLVTMVPISVAGWGVREGAMVVSFGFVGLPANEAFAVSVLIGVVVMLAGIPGGIIWLMTGHRFEKPLPVAPESSQSE
jgi:glycosyltransferase 2 family protein